VGVIENCPRGFGALSLAPLPLVASAGAQAAPAPQSLRAAEVTALADAVGLVTVAGENRTGYTRSSFKHWNSGDLADGCNTRNEVRRWPPGAG